MQSKFDKDAIFSCVCVCVLACVRVCVCVCARACVRAFLRVCLHAGVYSFVRALVHYTIPAAHGQTSRR